MSYFFQSQLDKEKLELAFCEKILENYSFYRAKELQKELGGTYQTVSIDEIKDLCELPQDLRISQIVGMRFALWHSEFAAIDKQIMRCDALHRNWLMKDFKTWEDVVEGFVKQCSETSQKETDAEELKKHFFTKNHEKVVKAFKEKDAAELRRFVNVEFLDRWVNLDNKKEESKERRSDVIQGHINNEVDFDRKISELLKDLTTQQKGEWMEGFSEGFLKAYDAQKRIFDEITS